MEGVLVDDDKAILRLGDDVAVVDLQESAAEQLLEGVGRMIRCRGLAAAGCRIL